MAAIYRTPAREIRADGFKVLNAAHLAHAAAQAVDRLEDLDHGVTRVAATAGRP